MPKIKIEKEFPLSLGGSLPEIEIVYEEWGDPKAAPERTVMIMPALSASSHACSTGDDPTPGWWEAMIGPGGHIDTNEYRVLCASILGSPFGSTSPLTTDPRTGRPYGCDFPQITPADQARMHCWLLEHLGIPRIHCAIGASLGGMQTLQFAALCPKQLDRVVSIAATGKTTPGTVAYRRVGRLAIMMDPDYKNGRYEIGKGPMRGLAVARELGMITYRSRDEFNNRFEWKPRAPFSIHEPAFDVEGYLQHHGRRFTEAFDANCYLILSRCMDLMDLGAGQETYADGVLRIDCRVLIMGVDRDVLIPLSEQQHLAHLLENHGRDVEIEVLSSIYGHDAFLKDFDWFGPRIKAFLTKP